MKASKELMEFVEELRQEALAVGNTRQGDGYSGMGNVGKLNGLVAGCRLLIGKLGPFGKIWDEMLLPPPNGNDEHFYKISGVLDAIAKAIANGRLSTIEEVISAEILGDLLEHAEVLINAKYYLAGAIILRAVLEERLRKLCESNNCMPTSLRPTIESFKQSLQAAMVVDKIGIKDIDWMAGIGNAAAHKTPEYKDEDVQPFYQHVTAFLARFSLT